MAGRKSSWVGFIATALALSSCAGGDADGNGGTIGVAQTIDGTLTTTDSYAVPMGGNGMGTINGDPFTVTLAPGMYTIRMCGRGMYTMLDAAVDVYEGTGSSAALVASGDDGAGGLDTLLYVMITTRDTYTIVARNATGTVNPTDPSGSDDYQLRIDMGQLLYQQYCPI